MKRQSRKQRADADRLTVTRIDAIMRDPKTPKKIKREAASLAQNLNRTIGVLLDGDSPDVAVVRCRAALAAFAALDESHHLYNEAKAMRDRLATLAAENEPEDLRVARRCVEIYNAEIARHEANPTREHTDGATFFLDEGVDAVMTNSSDNLIVDDPNHELFVSLFVRAAREYRGEEAPNAYTHLLDIIRRVDSGETLEAMHDEKERRLKERDEARRAETLAKPEPKNKLSAEWRYWKLRHIEHAVKNCAADGEAYERACAYVRELINGLVSDPDFWFFHRLSPMLANFIIARQHIDEQRASEQRASRKGAATRKANCTTTPRPMRSRGSFTTCSTPTRTFTARR